MLAESFTCGEATKVHLKIPGEAECAARDWVGFRGFVCFSEEYVQMKKRLLIAVLAGAAAPAFGQLTMTEQLAPTIKLVNPNTGEIIGERPVGAAMNRAVGVVYDNYIFNNIAIGLGSSINATHRNDLEDLNFAPGPWANVAVRDVTDIDISVRRVQANFSPDDSHQVTLRFFNEADVLFTGVTGAGSPMIVAGAVPVDVISLLLPSTNNNLINGFGYGPITGLTLPASGVVFVQATIETQADDLLATTDDWRLILSNSNGNTGLRVGSTAGGLGLDGGFGTNLTPLNGTFTGGAVNTAAPNEHVAIGFNGGVTPAGLDIALSGDIPATAPSSTPITLGADGAWSSLTGNNGQNGATWFSFTLTSDCIDENNKYVDIDTNGTAPTENVSIAIFSSEGSLIATDNDSGNDVDAQFSFGIGRRPATGDGVQFDGRNWTAAPALVRGLTAGTYYVAVATASAGTPSFAGGFGAIGNGFGGDFNIRVRTNDAGGTLDASVAPAATRITGISAEDPIVAPGGVGTSDLDGPGVTWYDVQICQASSAAEPITFATTGSDAGTYSVNIFDASGNQVTTGTGTAAVPFTQTWDGSSVLAAGTYYVAMSYVPVDLSGDPINAGRWHVRGRNASGGFTMRAEWSVAYSACTGGPSCDYDFNQDENVDLTDAQQMAQVFVGLLVPEANWLDGDLNGDENADLTDAQILASYVVTGNCGL